MESQGQPEVAPPSASQAQLVHQQHMQKHQQQQASTDGCVAVKKEEEAEEDAYVGSNDKQVWCVMCSLCVWVFW